MPFLNMTPQEKSDYLISVLGSKAAAIRLCDNMINNYEYVLIMVLNFINKLK